MAESLTRENASDYFVPAGSGSHHDLFPGVSIKTAAGRSMLISVVTFEPDSVVPDHSHHHEQMGVMVSGRLEFTVGGVTRVLGPGDIWRIPGGVVHTVRAIDGPAVALDVFHPIREDYLKKSAENKGFPGYNLPVPDPEL